MKSNTSPKVNIKDERSSVFEAANKKKSDFFYGTTSITIKIGYGLKRLIT